MNILWYAAAVCIAALSLAVPSAPAQQLLINEVAAANAGSHADGLGEHDDWVEIFNGGDEPVDLGGYYVTDDLAQPRTWRIPTAEPRETTVAPDDYLVLWFDGQPHQGARHVDTRLSRDGEQVGLFAPDGDTVVDSVTFGAQRSDFTYGRAADGASDWHFFHDPSPGAPNEDGRPGFAEPPSMSPEAGFYAQGVAVELAADGGAVRYTLDGAVPTSTSGDRYEAPIDLDAPTVVRAVAVED